MKKHFKWLIASLVCLAIAAACVLYIQKHTIAVLEPKGPIAQQEKDLIVTASELMLIVVIPVLCFAVAFAWRYREDNKDALHTPDWEHNTIAEYCWWGVPIFIVIFLAIFAYKSSHSLNPFSPISSEKKPLKIQVIALQWKWLFLYPEEKIATINYLKFPVGRPIAFEITSDAPMNSFWIPQLAGQIYAMPAMRSKLHLLAEKEGVYRGLSSNLSGTGFASMTFNAEVVDENQYSLWVDAAQQRDSFSFKQYSLLAAPSQNNPEETFSLGDTDLFEQVMMKYMLPTPSSAGQ